MLLFLALTLHSFSAAFAGPIELQPTVVCGQTVSRLAFREPSPGEQAITEYLAKERYDICQPGNTPQQDSVLHAEEKYLSIMQTTESKDGGAQQEFRLFQRITGEALRVSAEFGGPSEKDDEESGNGGADEWMRKHQLLRDKFVPLLMERMPPALIRDPASPGFFNCYSSDKEETKILLEVAALSFYINEARELVLQVDPDNLKQCGFAIRLTRAEVVSRLERPESFLLEFVR